MSEVTLTPDDDPHAARRAEDVATLRLLNQYNMAMAARAHAAAEAEAAQGRRDDAAEDRRSRILERVGRNVRRNLAMIDTILTGQAIITSRAREIVAERRQAVRKRAREAELVALQAIDAGNDPPEGQERLMAGLCDWIDHNCWDEDFAVDPILMIVRTACENLGFDLRYETNDKGDTVPAIRLPPEGEDCAAASCERSEPSLEGELADAGDAAKPP